MQRPRWWTFAVEGDSETQVRFRCGTAMIAGERAASLSRKWGLKLIGPKEAQK